MDQYKSLSRNLYNVMGNCGFTAEVRDTQVEMTRIFEILKALDKPSNVSICTFGSEYEGTCTGNASDIDEVYIDNKIPVVTSTGEFPSQDSLLLVPDKQPGYVRLQIVKNDIPLFSNTTNLTTTAIKYDLQVDKDDRICWIANPHYIPDGYRRQGPAFHTEAYDKVYAFKCTQWPSLASEWLHRQRNNGWPTPELIEECESLGFLVVAASHPDSDGKELQWRISFSEQERLLVAQFNSVQLMCYVLLKTIKNEIVKRKIQEDTLTSYHCKTCMLYMIENTSHEFWIPENLVICLNTCLRQIHAWVKDNNCPNYFIPDENMFDRITEVKLKEKLLKVLDKVLKSDIRIILEQVKTNDIGKKLTESHQTTQEQWKEKYRWNLQVHKAVRMKVLLQGVINTRNHLLVISYDKILESLINNMQDSYQNLKAIRSITNHSENETKTALSLILPFIKVHELSCKVVQKIQEGESYQEILTCEEWDKQYPIHGYSKLKQAMAMSTLGKHLDSLNLMSVDLISKKISLCQCVFYNCPAEKSLVSVPNKDDFTVVKVLNCYQPCVVFLPAEHLITHAAINYEMIRIYTMPSYQDHFIPSGPQIYHWLKRGVVDGIFMIFFLQYLNCQALGLNSQATAHIKIMAILLKRKLVNHRETCLNLLGWIHKERGDNHQAVQCFRESLETRSTYNAAFWHLCFMICGY